MPHVLMISTRPSKTHRFPPMRSILTSTGNFLNNNRLTIELPFGQMQVIESIRESGRGVSFLP